VTRKVSYLISLFMGGLTSIVRSGPLGRPPLLLAMKRLVVVEVDVDVDVEVVNVVGIIEEDEEEEE